jgi:hypothetical protein
MIPDIENFLKFELGLEVCGEKTMICDSNTGVEFSGAFLKPHRRYLANGSLVRILRRLPAVLAEADSSKINSYLGMLSHFSAYHLTKKMFFPLDGRGGYFTQWMKKWVEYPYLKG